MFSIRMTLCALLLLIGSSSFANDGSPEDKRRDKSCFNDLFRKLAQEGPKPPPPSFKKHPHEITIIFQRKKGEIITELVGRHRVDKAGQLTLYSADELIFDSTEPGAQKFYVLPEDSIAQAAQGMAKIAREDGFFRAVVIVNDDGEVLFLEVGPASSGLLDLVRKARKKPE